jgi:hypothetical protein
MRSFLIVALASSAAALAACSAKAKASNDYSAAMSEAHVALGALTHDLPALDADVEQVRVTDPNAAAAEIDAKIVPLFDHAVTAMQTADDAGHRYLATAEGEDKDALTAIQKSLDLQAKQRTTFAAARDLYREESRLLHAGPLSEADQRRIGTRMVQLFSGR